MEKEEEEGKKEAEHKFQQEHVLHKAIHIHPDMPSLQKAHRIFLPPHKLINKLQKEGENKSSPTVQVSNNSIDTYKNANPELIEKYNIEGNLKSESNL